MTIPTTEKPPLPAPAQIKINVTSVTELFAKYEKTGFLYPAKKKMLAPYLGRITRNWEKALLAKDQLLWILTHETSQREEFASISVWKQSNYGMMAQHLVSSGNPFLSLRLMLAAQRRAEQQYDNDSIRSSQNWFRPDNRYAFRVFASMYSKLGKNQAALSVFRYLQCPLCKINANVPSGLVIERVTGVNNEFIDFVKSEYGTVFVKGEELDTPDIELKQIGGTYAQFGLVRQRFVYKVKDKTSGRVIGSIIANRGPLGANFSFLENRAYVITEFGLSEEERMSVCDALLAAVKPHYEDFPLGVVPVVTNEVTGSTLEGRGGQFIREYVQSIWLREGFAAWYEHINSFLQRISRRKNVN